ncbi:Transcription factor, fungi [Penicillium italicum]|uniref:Transcription factor, fungi n=1 Tax=Penicillium italicum TaxID=40296 RepID=A0A0A2L3L0_PENIT|nr:Transcription factor, fungi [Penicillium italicum]
MAQKSWEGIEIGTARSPNVSWYGPSSLFYFIGRMNSYIDSSLHQGHYGSTKEMVLHGSANTLLGFDTFKTPDVSALSEDSPLPREKFLSPTQEEYFLDFFWKFYHTSLFPTINETEFMDHYRSLWNDSGDSRTPCALVDIVIALSMQYGVSRLAPEKKKPIADGDPSIAGRWYFRRAQMMLNYYLESPTVSTVQCFLLSAIYLCNGSFQNMSADACGSATRAAYTAGLHLDPPSSMPKPERELRRRLWWALYQLDAKIGMKLGRPFTLHRSSIEPRLPDDTPDTAMQSGSRFTPLGGNKTWLSFHLYNVKLFTIAKEIHVAFYSKELNLPGGQSIWHSPETLESHAGYLQSQMFRMDQWRDEVPTSLTTKRKGNGTTFSTDGSQMEFEEFAPEWLQRQRLNLELLYHTLCLNAYRPFISFNTGCQSALTRELATKCALHAVTLTSITHQALSSTTILNGWHESFQWQWNASMTIVGFVLANPHSELVSNARQAVDLSIAIFDMFGECFAVATSAARILRSLAPKIDFLLQSCPASQGSVAGPDGLDEAPVENLKSNEIGSGWLDSLMSDTSAFDPSYVVPMQELFQMAYSIEQWSGLDSLMPNMGEDQWTI